MKNSKKLNVLCAFFIGSAIIFNDPCAYNDGFNSVAYAAYQQWQGYCANKTTAYTNAALTQRNGVEYVGAGDTVTVLNEQGNAYYVSYPLTKGGTKERWVPKNAVIRLDNNPVIQAVEGVIRGYQQWQGYCANRTTAYTNAALTQRNGVEYVGAGDTVTVLNEQGNAYYVSYPLTKGGTKERWVPKSAVTRTSNNAIANAATQAAQAAAEKQYQQWQGYCANRTTAYTNAALTQRNGVEYVGAGDTVTVLNEQGNAYYVSYPLTRGGTKERWVPKSAVTRTSNSAIASAATQAAQAAAEKQYQQWQGYCANRTTAYTNAALTQRNGVEYVGAGDTVTVLNEQGNAYYVSYPLTRGGTKERWVPKSAVTRTNNSAIASAATQAAQAAAEKQYQQWQGYCANRTTAYTNAALTQRNGVEYVGAGDTVTVLNEQGNAYYVSYPLTRGGTKERWIPKSAVQKRNYSNPSSTSNNIQSDSVSNDVIAKMDKLQKTSGFKPDTTYIGKGQCRGFANGVYKELFKNVDGFSDTTSDNIGAGEYPGSYIVGQIRESNMPSDYPRGFNPSKGKYVPISQDFAYKIKQLFLQSKSGYFVQMARRMSLNRKGDAGTPHSAIIYKIDDNGCYFYEANAGNEYNRITLKHYTWQKLAERNLGFTIYAPNNYS